MGSFSLAPSLEALVRLFICPLPLGIVVTPSLHIHTHTHTQVQLLSQDLDSLLLCSHELLLPNLSTLHTRMLLGAWETGLEGVSEEAAKLLMFALEVHKSLLAGFPWWHLWKPGCHTGMFFSLSPAVPPQVCDPHNDCPPH